MQIASASADLESIVAPIPAAHGARDERGQRHHRLRPAHPSGAVAGDRPGRGAVSELRATGVRRCSSMASSGVRRSRPCRGWAPGAWPTCAPRSCAFSSGHRPGAAIPAVVPSMPAAQPRTAVPPSGVTGAETLPANPATRSIQQTGRRAREWPDAVAALRAAQGTLKLDRALSLLLGLRLDDDLDRVAKFTRAMRQAPWKAPWPWASATGIWCGAGSPLPRRPGAVGRGHRPPATAARPAAVTAWW